MVKPIVKRNNKVREGRGFSLKEIREVGLNPGEARHLGIPVDIRRSSHHEENVEILRDWLEEAREEGFRVPKPKQSSKPHVHRARRGLTSAGKKVRGLRK
jgi:large subunit ribosomal protein L13e